VGRKRRESLFLDEPPGSILRQLRILYRKLEAQSTTPRPLETIYEYDNGHKRCPRGISHFRTDSLKKGLFVRPPRL